VAEFSPAARAAIYEAGDGACVGCGRSNLNAQHRCARGMGGSRNPLRSTPANGVPICGSGTTGCHGWTERHPLPAGLMGWRLAQWQDQLTEPFWTRFGWKIWTCVDGFYAVAYVDESELADVDARMAAVREYNAREDGWR
jgi:hypothetical protein